MFTTATLYYPPNVHIFCDVYAVDFVPSLYPVPVPHTEPVQAAEEAVVRQDVSLDLHHVLYRRCQCERMVHHQVYNTDRHAPVNALLTVHQDLKHKKHAPVKKYAMVNALHTVHQHLKHKLCYC